MNSTFLYVVDFELLYVLLVYRLFCTTFTIPKPYFFFARTAFSASSSMAPEAIVLLTHN